MNQKPDLPERIGRTINELDIDFSRFTVIGWMASFLALGGAGGMAYLVCGWMVRRNGFNLTAGMIFFLIMVGVTTFLFLILRAIAGRIGFPVTKPLPKQAIRERP